LGDDDLKGIGFKKVIPAQAGIQRLGAFGKALPAALRRLP